MLRLVGLFLRLLLGLFLLAFAVELVELSIELVELSVERRLLDVDVLRMRVAIAGREFAQQSFQSRFGSTLSLILRAHAPPCLAASSASSKVSLSR